MTAKTKSAILNTVMYVLLACSIGLELIWAYGSVSLHLGYWILGLLVVLLLLSFYQASFHKKHPEDTYLFPTSLVELSLLITFIVS